MTINITSVSGQHIYQESGASVVVASGLGVLVSGQHVYVESGVHVIADIAESGLHVQISGQPVTISGDHVYVESGVFLASGNVVGISGQHVYVESGVFFASGAYVVTAVDVSGTPVTISGDHVFVESGVYLASGIYVVATVSVDSGLGVLISGQHVYVESGVYLASGNVVGISGQHVFQESGAFVAISGQGVVIDTSDTSGQTIHVGCAAKGRTGKYVQLLGGTSGWPGSGSYHGSGGLSLCVSGQWCSGPVHTLIVKNLAGNDVVWVGFVDCKPYSGYGFPLQASEGVNLDMCDVCDVWVLSQTSGQYVSWIGTDY